MPNDFDNLEPATREEAFLDDIATGADYLDPVTREEAFLKMIALGKAGETVPDIDPITRREYFLKKIAESFTGGGGEMESGIFTSAGGGSEANITFANSHSSPPDLIVMAAKFGGEVVPEETSTETTWAYLSIENLVDSIWTVNNVGWFGIVISCSWVGSGNGYTQVTSVLKNSYDNLDATVDKNNPRYWVSPTGFKATYASGSTAKYFKLGVEYEWHAFWLH